MGISTMAAVTLAAALLFGGGQSTQRAPISAEGVTSASVIVNIEGVITEVSEDGSRLVLDSGQAVLITAETVMGIEGPNAAPKEEQFFESSFRVGNSIAGFTEDAGDEVIAYAIYTNWNWEDPVRP